MTDNLGELREKIAKANLIRDHRYLLKNVVLVTIDDVIEIFHQLAPYSMGKLDEARELEKAAIDTLAKAQLNMRPLMALKNGNGEPDGDWYVMYWDDSEQVWDKARYADIVKEVKAALTTNQEEEKPL